MKKLILLLALLPFLVKGQTITGKVDLSNYYTKSQVDSAIKVANKPTVPPVDIPDTPPVGLPNCDRGPEPKEISNISTTSLSVLWDGINVFGFDYSIYKGGERVAFGSVIPTSNRIGITYAGLQPGTYTLNLTGNTCKSGVYSKTFVVPEPSGTVVIPPPSQGSSKRKIIMNATGSGFDVDDPTGIRPTIRDQAEAYCNLEYNGHKFRGIDYLQLSARWLNYEPTEGDFTRGDKQMLAAQKWCKARGLGLCIEFIMWRQTGDGMFSDDQKETLSNGEIWTSNPVLNRDIYMPAISSDIAREKISRTLQHLASILSKDPSAAYYIAVTTAQTGEYQAIVQESPQLITGFSNADKVKWAIYSQGKSMPNGGQVANDETLAHYMDTENGRLWYNFRTSMLKEFHATCVRAIRNGGMKAGAMYAGVGAATAVHNFTFRINEIFSAGTSDQPDVIYSSEGDSGSQWRKLLAADLNLGTFPGSVISMEFDHDDASWTQERNPPQDTPINPNLVYEYAESFFRRGGEDFHLAMDYLPKIIKGFSEPFWKVRNEAEGATLPQGNPIEFQITTFSGGQGYIDQWQNQGGGLNKKVPIVIK